MGNIETSNLEPPVYPLVRRRNLAALCMAIFVAAQPCFPSAFAAATASAPAKPAPVEDSPVVKAMEKELTRSFAKLKNAGPAPIYFISYRLYDQESVTLTSSNGGLEDTPDVRHDRRLSVELRAGSPKLDSNHHARNVWSNYWRETAAVPIEDDENALRAILWDETDTAFKKAQAEFKEVQADKDVLVAEEDISNDFSVEKPQRYVGPAAHLDLDLAAWQNRVRTSSALYKQFPKILQSEVALTVHKTRRYIVTSEGTKLEDELVQYNLFTLAGATADDGMRVWLYDHVESPTVQGLPDEKKLAAIVTNTAKAVVQLREAPVAEPFAGPAILRSKAAGVFFHEVFGHRAEGHRQKDEEGGKTFTKMVGKKIMPDFITVRDDPTCRELAGKWLNGFYRFDDEGVPASNVVLVNHGILKNFLLGRSPIKGFDKSNGHGRSSPGADPVARQANLIVQSSKQVPYNQLRQMLKAEIRKQGKPYGLIFDEIAGGFTFTEAWLPQLFKLMPLRVYRVYPDNRPDQLLRGVSIIGTPLVSLETIMCAATDCDTFNGNCGAESGWVPVSASSPSLLLRKIEVERQLKGQEKPPLLPPPVKGQ